MVWQLWNSVCLRSEEPAAPWCGEQSEQDLFNVCPTLWCQVGTKSHSDTRLSKPRVMWQSSALPNLMHRTVAASECFDIHLLDPLSLFLFKTSLCIIKDVFLLLYFSNSCSVGIYFCQGPSEVACFCR